MLTTTYFLVAFNSMFKKDSTLNKSKGFLNESLGYIRIKHVKLES